MTQRALVVDDASDIRMLVRSVLRGRLGFDVTEASNGREALTILRSIDPFDVVVLDVQMPLLDGWETLSAIRENERTRDLPVILCTVRSQPADAERAWSLGCDGFVSKPFAIDRLAEEVVAACQHTVAERAALREQHLAVARSLLGANAGQGGA